MDLRLFVIESHPLRRRLICESIAATPGFVLQGESTSLDDFRSEPWFGPPILLLNASMLRDCLQELRVLADIGRLTTLLLFDTRSDAEPLIESIDLPVAGYLSFNHLTREDFSRSLQAVAHGGAVIEPYTAQLLLDYLRDIRLTSPEDDASASTLTEREHEVLGLVRHGLSNKEIAYRMQISLGTVRSHLRSIFRKLDVSSRAGAAARFRPRHRTQTAEAS